MPNELETKRQPKVLLKGVGLIGTKTSRPYRTYETLGVVLEGESLDLAREHGWKIRSNKVVPFFIEAALRDGETLSYKKSRENRYNVEVYGIEWTMRHNSGVKLCLVSIEPVK